MPNGWNAVSMYTHNDSSTLMIIEKVTDTINNPVHDFFHNPAPHGIFDTVAHNPAPVNPAGYATLSPVDASFTLDSISLFSNSDTFSMVESNWMNPAPVSPAVPSVVLTLPPYDPPVVYVHTLLLPHGSVIGPQSPPVFVGCNLEVFNEGISYMPTYLKDHFPAAWTIIPDARLACG
ncbi:hypothetical protein DFH29DRAFT_1004334 [Suillus ampliporus]|nr:hypothetical protein DFH29DRAFT_1004334 [Suillus ampliporus]